MAQQNPHRVDLGNAVAAHRGSMSSKQLEALLGWSSGKISRIEDGKWTLKDSEVLDLARALALTSGQTEELRSLAALARKRKPMLFIAEYAVTYVAFEQAAVRIDAYSDELIPGISQAPAYATAVMSSAGLDDVAERVAARIDRQKILTREDPPRVRVMVGEAALHRLVGGTTGLKQQLEHMVSLLDMERIQLGIVRFALGQHECQAAKFNIVRRANGDTRVYVESARTAVYLHEATAVADHQAIFDRLWDRSARDEESETILRKRIQQLA